MFGSLNFFFHLTFLAAEIPLIAAEIGGKFGKIPIF